MDLTLEPETTGVFVTDLVFENCRFIDPGLGHVAATAWPHVRRVRMRNCDFIATSDRGGPFFTGGWWEGTLENCTFIRHLPGPAPDIEFHGRGVSISNCLATGGLLLGASTRNDENAVSQTADYISVNGWRSFNPTTVAFASAITHYTDVNNITLGGSYAEQYA